MKRRERDGSAGTAGAVQDTAVNRSPEQGRRYGMPRISAIREHEAGMDQAAVLLSTALAGQILEKIGAPERMNPGTAMSLQGLYKFCGSVRWNLARFIHVTPAVSDRAALLRPF